MTNYKWDNSGMLDNMQNMGMKRYKLLTGEGYGKYIARHVVDQEGEWVKWEDVKKYLGVEATPVVEEQRQLKQVLGCWFTEDYVDYLFERRLVEAWGYYLTICGRIHGYLPEAFKAIDPDRYAEERAKFIEENFDVFTEAVHYVYAWKDASKFDPEDYRQFQNRV